MRFQNIFSEFVYHILLFGAIFQDSFSGLYFCPRGAGAARPLMGPDFAIDSICICIRAFNNLLNGLIKCIPYLDLASIPYLDLARAVQPKPPGLECVL